MCCVCISNKGGIRKIDNLKNNLLSSLHLLIALVPFFLSADWNHELTVPRWSFTASLLRPIVRCSLHASRLHLPFKPLPQLPPPSSKRPITLRHLPISLRSASPPQPSAPSLQSMCYSVWYRPHKKDLHVTFGHYYRVDVFNFTLDKQLLELNNRFNEDAMELLSLSSSLVSKEINVDQICLLVEKYYPTYFNDQDRTHLRYQMELFNIEGSNNNKLSGASTIFDLCKSLVDTKKRETYYLVDRVIRLILTLPVSTATTERGFLAMKIFKNRLRNKMSDDYLANNLVIYIEKKIAENFDSESIIDEFKNLKERRAEL
ncbi:hypothetical protein E3N88_17928 [Mikania micrantha]|uniref:HAT C-terminal dimerisation domain-containing protein n=1 Tax=Mikania micrantha TaxID=192012 RepID=A0A5N6NT72_9ASTR|nr:hypothetical protein E3N88_17928 [Mikania micrantha]